MYCIQSNDTYQYAGTMTECDVKMEHEQNVASFGIFAVSTVKIEPWDEHVIIKEEVSVSGANAEKVSDIEVNKQVAQLISVSPEVVKHELSELEYVEAYEETTSVISTCRRNSGGTSNTIKQYGCNICDATFTQQYNCMSHIRTHSGERPYSCDKCKSTFTRRSHLVSHNRTHTGEKPYSCDICDGTFTQHSYLVSHIRTHTGERPYNCSICKASFKQSSHLVSHIRTHTGERPYNCGICKASFTLSAHLVSHVRTHTGEKPYNCSKCKAAFARRSDLVRHFRTHAGGTLYSCSICCAPFTHRTGLTYHTRTCTYKEPFSCSRGKVSFADHSINFINSCEHTGRRRQKNWQNLDCIYYCLNCEAKFTQRSSLIQHYRHIHVHV